MDVRSCAGRLAVVVAAGVTTVVGAGVSASATTPAPRITKCAPLGGTSAGKPVTIDGTGLAGATKVTFNAVAGTPTANTAEVIKVKVPTGAKVASDTIHVTTPGGTATCAFTVKKKTKK